ncbi:MAG: hypothetical protein E7Z99_08790 [Coriobacteriaceae bacterium]|nr:hypothetical protein [Coriobacteriaceae bacterium]
MKSLSEMFGGGPKDERSAAQLGPIYKVGFYIMVFGILFDIFTRYNYLAQTDANGSIIATSPIEFGVLIAACLVVAFMMMRRGVYSDSMRFLESRTFSESGMIAPSIALGAMVAVAATGGRLVNEVILFGWGGVTWAGDFAMLVIMLVMFVSLILLVNYLSWRAYRRQEDALARESD